MLGRGSPDSRWTMPAIFFTGWSRMVGFWGKANEAKARTARRSFMERDCTARAGREARRLATGAVPPPKGGFAAFWGVYPTLTRRAERPRRASRWFSAREMESSEDRTGRKARSVGH